MIITETDYDHTKDYRQKIYDAMRADLAESNLVIIGHSLTDQDIKEEIARAISINSESMAGGRITLVMYIRDENRASLYESKGIRVVFGGIDEFFSELAKCTPSHRLVASSSDNPVSDNPALNTSVVDIEHELAHADVDVSRMFNGGAASYADIQGRLTFQRNLVSELSEGLIDQGKAVGIILGASGVGKTTAARQALLKIRERGFKCWEHKSDDTLDAAAWIAAALKLHHSEQLTALLIDDAHEYLHEINELIDGIINNNITSFKLVLSTSRNNWLLAIPSGYGTWVRRWVR